MHDDWREQDFVFLRTKRAYSEMDFEIRRRVQIRFVSMFLLVIFLAV